MSSTNCSVREEFEYLELACPVCGGRIDEMDWCNCGTMGAG
jgi:hypothetical protein